MKTNDTARVTAETMPETERASAPDPAIPSIYALIAAYWTAYGFLMEVQDEGSEQEMAACRHLTATEVAICAYIPTRAYEARVKADFINRLATESLGMLDRECTKALLATLPKLYAQEVAA